MSTMTPRSCCLAHRQCRLLSESMNLGFAETAGASKCTTRSRVANRQTGAIAGKAHRLWVWVRINIVHEVCGVSMSALVVAENIVSNLSPFVRVLRITVDSHMSRTRHSRQRPCYHQKPPRHFQTCPILERGCDKAHSGC